MTRKSVLVCGDLVWDTNVARLPVTGLSYYEPHPHTQLSNRYCGAWYVRDMVRAALRDVDVDIQAPKEVESHLIAGAECPPAIARAFSVWTWCKGTEKPGKAKLSKLAPDRKADELDFKWSKGRPDPGAWRIAEFLGCRSATWDGDPSYPEIVADDAAGAVAPSAAPDVLVIDDAGLGFADHEACWPAALDDVSAATRVVVKTTGYRDSALWRKLLAPELAPRVTVVVSADSLRAAGAEIARGMSWDRTLEDLRRQFEVGGEGRVFRHCRRVVVICGRSGAGIFSRDPRSPTETDLDAVRFERLVFDPSQLEDQWSAAYEGRMFGTASVMTAAFVRHELSEEPVSTHIAAGRGLAAARRMLRLGAGSGERSFDVRAADDSLFLDGEPWTDFRTAFPRELLDAPELTPSEDSATPPSILNDIVGVGSQFLTVTAQNIVFDGPDRHLESAPQLKFGPYLTVDREEIENLNTVRVLIQQYRTGNDKRPLSIAVFGAPGSGKSFAIKQLSKELFGEERAVLEFNLSQFHDVADLHEAFHKVRDASVRGRMPLVFWDEFDARRGREDLGWLKEFLAPMQDAEFIVNGGAHPFGKCVFVFAGGTSKTLQEFDRSGDMGNGEFRAAKGPDFVSRLRGYVNIKGPNPVVAESDRSPDDETGATGEPKAEPDAVHVVRRGILLRSFVERHHPSAIRPADGKLDIHPRVLAAFLGVRKYKHGARSMEALVSLSLLHDNRVFGPSELPPPEVIKLHVSDDFMEIVNDRERYRLSQRDVERLAEIKHEAWRAAKSAKGYVHGPVRDDGARPPTHPLVRPFDELDEATKEGNRLPARLAVLRLEGLGFRIVPAERATVAPSDLDEALEALARSEHRRWMREKLIQGVSFARDTSDERLVHKDLCKFDDLPEDERWLDRDIIAAIFTFLAEKGLGLDREPAG